MDEARNAAVVLVGRLSISIGVMLVVLGATETAYLYAQSRRGVEAMATIDAAKPRMLGTGGWVDLSWQDASGNVRQALGVEVTSDLGRRLRLGYPLMRSQVRIRYRPDRSTPGVVVVEDEPMQVRRASTLTIAGFLAITGGSMLMLWRAMRRWMPDQEREQ